MRSLVLWVLLMPLLVGQKADSPFDAILSRKLQGYGAEAFARASSFEAWRLGPEPDPLPKERKGLWVGPHPAVGAALRSSPAWTRSFLNLIGDARNYEWRFSKECAPTPGVLLRVPDPAGPERRPWDILLCFECDMIGFGRSPEGPELFGAEGVRWMDFDPARGTLLKLVRELFPKDGLLAGLSEKREEDEEWIQEIEVPDDHLPEPQLRFSELPEERIGDFGIEAWCLLFFAKGRYGEEGDSLGDDTRAHLLELLVRAPFARAEIPTPKGKPAFILSFESPYKVEAPPLRFVLAEDLRAFATGSKDGPLRWIAMPEAAPFWHRLLSWDLEIPVAAKPKSVMDPASGIWADWMRFDSHEVRDEIEELFGEEFCESFCDATRLAPLRSGREKEEPRRFWRDPWLYPLRLALLDPKKAPEALKKGEAAPESFERFVFYRPQAEEGPIELRLGASGSVFSFARSGREPRWFRSHAICTELRRQLDILRRRPFSAVR